MAAPAPCHAVAPASVRLPTRGHGHAGDLESGPGAAGSSVPLPVAEPVDRHPPLPLPLYESASAHGTRPGLHLVLTTRGAPRFTRAPSLWVRPANDVARLQASLFEITQEPASVAMEGGAASISMVERLRQPEWHVRPLVGGSRQAHLVRKTGPTASHHTQIFELVHVGPVHTVEASHAGAGAGTGAGVAYHMDTPGETGPHPGATIAHTLMSASDSLHDVPVGAGVGHSVGYGYGHESPDAEGQQQQRQQQGGSLGASLLAASPAPLAALPAAAVAPAAAVPAYALIATQTRNRRPDSFFMRSNTAVGGMDLEWDSAPRALGLWNNHLVCRDCSAGGRLVAQVHLPDWALFYQHADIWVAPEYAHHLSLVLATMFEHFDGQRAHLLFK